MNTNIYDIASKDINPLVHNRKSLLYCNFSNTTSNPYIKEHKNCRIKLWEILKNIKIPVTNVKSQKDYLTDLSNYVYCLCPPGNGCDSHRLWEALMMNCIPVVIKYEPISELYKNLPVLVLDKWEDLTVELLNSKKEYFSNFVFNRELIYKKYYIDKIKKEAEPICKLQSLQNKLKITGGDFKEELVEQIIATKYINENDKVLEIGGNIGRNSMIIASLLNKPENLTVMETDPESFKILKHNKEINNMNFKIINAGLSKKKLLQNSWDTYYSDSIEHKHDYFEVNNITYQDLINKTGGDFNVLVLDCEGAFYYILKEFPEIITNIDKILIENDYKTIDEKKYVDDILFNNNFVSVFKDYHPDKWGPFYNNFYEVYQKKITKPKIIDCFIFYNELDILTYRLNILNDVVDYFVLVESIHTFVGKEKPLFYQENKQLFEKFNHKIIHIIVDDFPHKYPNINIEDGHQWINERFQRNCISRGIDKLSLQNNDVITITDLDEIPNPKILAQIKNNEIVVDINIIELDLYYYNLHTKWSEKWILSKILSYKKYKEIGLSCEQIRQNKSFTTIKNAGWHLSYFGNEKFIKNKLENFCHQEYNKVEFTDEKKIRERIKNGNDLFDRPIISIPIEENDNLPHDYNVYLKNFYYTDSIQNIKTRN